MRFFSEPGDLPKTFFAAFFNTRANVFRPPQDLFPSPIDALFLSGEQKASWGFFVVTSQDQITALPVNTAFCVHDSAKIFN